MNINDFAKQSGTFLKAADITADTMLKISGEALVVHNEKFDTDRLHIPVEIGAKEYTFDCSKTNARAIQVVLGDDTSKWISHELILEKYKTKTSDGKMVEAINIKSVK